MIEPRDTVRLTDLHKSIYKEILKSNISINYSENIYYGGNHTCMDIRIDEDIENSVYKRVNKL